MIFYAQLFVENTYVYIYICMYSLFYSSLELLDNLENIIKTLLL